MNTQIFAPASPAWHSALFWQKIFIYCWIFSLGGHFFELVWAQLYHFATGDPLWHPLIVTTLPLALPYGFGIVAIILFVVPLIKKYKLHPIAVFVFTMIVASIIEYLCALFVVSVYGYNRFWDYSHLPFNLHGYISAGSSLVFAVIATAFVFYVYPFCEKWFKHIKPRHINIIFWVMFVMYGADLLLTYF